LTEAASLVKNFSQGRRFSYHETGPNLRNPRKGVLQRSFGLLQRLLRFRLRPQHQRRWVLLARISPHPSRKRFRTPFTSMTWWRCRNSSATCRTTSNFTIVRRVHVHLGRDRIVRDRSSRITRTSCHNATRSATGCGWRRSAGISTVRMPSCRKRWTRRPPAPQATQISNASRIPRARARTQAWAPPHSERVITCRTRGRARSGPASVPAMSVESPLPARLTGFWAPPSSAPGPAPGRDAPPRSP
jgi:hypothetical protein